MKAHRHILWGWGWLERQSEFWRVFVVFALHLPLVTNLDKSSLSNIPISHDKSQNLHSPEVEHSFHSSSSSLPRNSTGHHEEVQSQISP